MQAGIAHSAHFTWAQTRLLRQTLIRSVNQTRPAAHSNIRRGGGLSTRSLDAVQRNPGTHHLKPRIPQAASRLRSAGLLSFSGVQAPHGNVWWASQNAASYKGISSAARNLNPSVQKRNNPVWRLLTSDHRSFPCSSVGTPTGTLRRLLGERRKFIEMTQKITNEVRTAKKSTKPFSPSWRTKKDAGRPRLHSHAGAWERSSRASLTGCACLPIREALRSASYRPRDQSRSLPAICPFARRDKQPRFTFAMK